MVASYLGIGKLPMSEIELLIFNEELSVARSMAVLTPEFAWPPEVFHNEPESGLGFPLAVMIPPLEMTGWSSSAFRAVRDPNESLSRS